MFQDRYYRTDRGVSTSDPLDLRSGFAHSLFEPMAAAAAAATAFSIPITIHSSSSSSSSSSGSRPSSSSSRTSSPAPREFPYRPQNYSRSSSRDRSRSRSRSPSPSPFFARNSPSPSPSSFGGPSFFSRSPYGQPSTTSGSSSWRHVSEAVESAAEDEAGDSQTNQFRFGTFNHRSRWTPSDQDNDNHGVGSIHRPQARAATSAALRSYLGLDDDDASSPEDDHDHDSTPPAPLGRQDFDQFQELFRKHFDMRPPLSRPTSPSPHSIYRQSSSSTSSAASSPPTSTTNQPILRSWFPSEPEPEPYTVNGRHPNGTAYGEHWFPNSPVPVRNDTDLSDSEDGIVHFRVPQLKTVTPPNSSQSTSSYRSGEKSYSIDGGHKYPLIYVPWRNRYLARRVAVSNGSCLFHALAFATKNRYGRAQSLRRYVSRYIVKYPDVYYEAAAASPTRTAEEYAERILHPREWGGALEISILSQLFQMEIKSLYIHDGRIDHYGEHMGYSEVALLLYTGSHYDAVGMTDHLDESYEDDQTVFPVEDGSIIAALHKLGDKIVASKAA
ncbi:hypothetical protein BJ085DRAFT_27311 [Dimargaris cristalligena]|uniref:Ubiquitin thioesterase OTU n=1 Tax=Dimargaris cristalligena TaxID=215637 RepID=A0A4P9ZV56_9FUNG|nr:hypothetical protein BJ085DRAFT_27311 [Dimargaris cristalligena]|eukprot:RKP36500.1 hypothetical protein BJ085DRAFT_27311 [Dimargaris cristalligena]